ncbi:adenylyl-sulfate kinase [Heyndrickxia acidicola]|uniref:Adenylyl-sulfate kinase n=1 Tax=Heyndrickxia acidicola TaxID=209389 RepID=A0ABU6MM20_9BACI|nr:adenylyl-sulfate kinase [Heyndrickxia acidicola]MED1205413.1 adenylyl-sulfate kinase [Heyndrickxia acidicola]
MTANIVWHDMTITKQNYRLQAGHSSGVIWFTGLSGAGKSTIANILNKKLYHQQVRNYLLDGDNLRHGLNKGLGFSEDDRKENIRRTGEVAKLFVDSGTIVLVALISPFKADRDLVRESLETNEFLEIYVECPISECEARDPKGLYEKARKGEIQSFTGIDSPYEEPVSPELVLHSGQYTAEQCADQIIELLLERKWI